MPVLPSGAMIWISIVLVFGTLALIGASLAADVPDHLGAGLLIHGRLPWILLAALWGGVALGAASLLRGRRLPKLGVLLLEIPLAALVSGYVLFGAALPAREPLAVDVGDPFPAYALEDQDGVLHRVAALEKRPPALYIFYRGHW